MESIPSKTRGKTRVPTLTTTIQYSVASYSNQRRKRNKRNPIGKEEVKFSLFAGDMKLCIENPKDIIKK